MVSFSSSICTYNLINSKQYGRRLFEQRLNSFAPVLDELVFLKNDYELSNTIKSDYILKSTDLLQEGSEFILYKEYFNGIPLIQYLKDWEFNVPEFITLAINATKILDDLHKAKLIIKDYSLSNLLINPQDKSLKLCSLGSASELRKMTIEYQAEFDLYGSLWHIAPEQTGRIGRSVDYRSDYYALGVILYHMACGRYPFEYQTTLELVHAHIAKTPISPKTLNVNISKHIEQLILKLLAKEADMRYQSTVGILFDLDKCLRIWQNDESGDTFIVGEKDRSNFFSIPEKLYGRDEEITIITDRWNDAKTNASKFLLVSGFSGIGKTRLINELRAKVFEDNSYFITGKFDQLNRDVEYSAFLNAIGDLVQIILSEPQPEVDKWKDIILESVGEDIVFIIELLPSLQLLVSENFEPIRVGPIEGRQRLTDAIIALLGVFHMHKSALALFIDDLQWSDTASQELLTKLIQKQTKGILVIGAYRSNEVDDSHPLSMTIRSIEKQNPRSISKIELTELVEIDVNHLLSDTFHLPVEGTQELSHIIYNKTKGNPFFVKELLHDLYKKDYLRYNANEEQWNWEISDIEKLNISIYVVDLLLNRMSSLSAKSQDVISIAACIGSTFDFNSLMILSAKSNSELSDILWELAMEDYINPIGFWGKLHASDLWDDNSSDDSKNYEFQFQHDRIQEAAYSLIPEKDRMKKHYEIGKILLNESDNDQLFTILNHFVKGQDLIGNRAEKNEISALCLKGGVKALENNVSHQSYQYFSLGLQLLENQSTTELYKDLLIGKSECAYLFGDYEQSERLFDEAILNAESNLAKADILSKKMALYENTQRHELAIDTAREALNLLSINLPKKVTQVHVMKELLKAKFALRNKKADSLMNNRQMDSADKIIAMKTLMNLWGPAYLLQKQELLAFKILKMVNYSIKYGNSIESALAYAFYGYVISAQLKDYDRGCEFANLGLKLNEKLNDKTLRSKVIVIAEGCVAHWNRPYKDMLSKLAEAFKIGVETNDIIYAGYATTFMNRINVMSGMKLQDVLSESKGFFKFVYRVNATISQQQMLPWSRFVFDLIGETPSKEIFKELVDEEDHLQHLHKLNDELNLQLPLANYYSSKCIYHYIMNEYDEALSAGSLADPLMDSVIGLLEWAEQKVFKTLTALALQSEGGKVVSKIKKQIPKTVKTMKRWAEVSPSNFKAKYLLVKAEQSALEGKKEAAIGFYKQAIEAAEEFGLHHLVAICSEKLAQFYKKIGQADVASAALNKASIGYFEWGAHAKVRQLSNSMYGQHAISSNQFGTGQDTAVQSLDINTILQAAQALSGEVKINAVLDKLLLILVRNAGAQNVYFIRHQSNHFIIEAKSKLETQNTLQTLHMPLEEEPLIHQALVRKSFATKEFQIVHDVKQEIAISNEKYDHLKARSILCLPILSKSEILALIYMDNDVSSNVFTKDRIQLLQMLSGQIAISLENAELYEDLESRVVERTRIIEEQKVELEESKLQSEKLLANILPSEIAQELKSTGKAMPRKYETVSIMFTDFKDFTKMSEQLSPEALVEIVDTLYQAFDDIVEKYGVEKIKTIGDSYMCVSGLPIEKENHALQAVLCALDILSYVDEYNEERKAAALPFCEIRIGIHSGPVVAGVVGHKKFTYDIWGDSVNTAARIQSACEAGRLNLSKTTYELIKNDFTCTHRGEIQVKNKGNIEMYYVEQNP